jgi:RimJ/RimL family protein N-acetyltransferase
MSDGPVGGTPPGTGFGDGELSGGTVGGVPGSGGCGDGDPGPSGGFPGCSGDVGSGLINIPSDGLWSKSQAMPALNHLGQPIGEPVPGWSAPLPPPREAVVGVYCRLEPLAVDVHARPLWDANALDTEHRNWTYLFHGPYASFDDYAAWVRGAAATTDPLFFAVIDRADRAAGVAAYLRTDVDAGSIEVGHINFSPLLQRTAAATEAMYLMMKRVFELGYRRYEWKCDALNAPSRFAASRLGFTFEGVFRQALIYKGRNRDTAWYSVIDREWPAIRHEFERWLAPDNFDATGTQRTRLAILKTGIYDK